MKFPPDLLEQLRRTRRIAVFTGAGVSAESGVPTFRDAQTGLWANFRPEELATPDAFRRDPVMVWNWYAWRRRLIGAVRPNRAHLAIATLEQLVDSVTVITQNVDGLHAAAGSSNVIELHGNIWDSICFQCRRPATRLLDQIADRVPPRCGHCGGPLRPGVVWFGEMLPEGAMERAFAACEEADLFFCVGTSSLVEPAASLPAHAKASGCVVVQVNPKATAHDQLARHVLRGKAGDLLPALLGAAWPAA